MRAEIIGPRCGLWSSYHSFYSLLPSDPQRDLKHSQKNAERLFWEHFAMISSTVCQLRRAHDGGAAYS